jgi:threonine dehydrogenase-like Zn-dependent dehydrogenase
MTIPRERMHAARIRAPRQSEIQEIVLPRPGPKQVRVRLEGCGVCGSNLAVWQGRPWFSYPFEAGAPGHEGWGTVDQLGTDVDNVRIGDRVALLSYRAYAEYDVADADAVVSFPSQLSIFPGEALGCALNVFRRSAIESGQAVAVIGIGFLGGLLVQLAARAGARVIAISRRSFALEIARRCGAAETVTLSALSDATARVLELTENRGCERVIEAAGEQPALDLAGELVAVRGRLIIAGYHQAGERRVNMQLWNWRGIDVVNAHERDAAKYIEGMQAAAEAVARGALDPSALYTHSYTLEELPDAFAALEGRPDKFLKAWIRTDV